MALASDARVFPEGTDTSLPAKEVKKGDRFSLSPQGTIHVAILDAIVEGDGSVSIPSQEVRNGV